MGAIFYEMLKTGKHSDFFEVNLEFLLILWLNYLKKKAIN